MAGPALLNSPYVNHIARNFSLKFMVVGDGARATDEGSPPEVARSVKSVPFFNATSVAYNPALDVLVVATKDPGKPFMLSNKRGDVWKPPTSVSSVFDGYIERLFFEPLLNIFIAYAAPSAKANDYKALTGTPDGKNWAQRVFRPGPSGPTGYDFSASLGFALANMSGSPNYTYKNNSGTFTTRAIGGYDHSLVASVRNGNFLAFTPGSQSIQTTIDGLAWGNHPYAIPSPCGTIAGTFAAYAIQRPEGERLLIFTVGGTAPAWYSDDNGLNWTACQGMENTGSVTRYVAVDGNAVYVAFNAELNKGMISLDYGQTWERSDHLSGNASGVIAL